MSELDTLPCAVLITDASGLVLETNDAMRLLLGDGSRDWALRSMDGMLPPAGRVLLQTHIWPILLREQRASELYLHVRDQNGQDIPVLVNCARAPGIADRYTWVLFVAHQRSRFEAELLRARASAQTSADDLSMANLELTRLHAQLKHHSEAIEHANLELAALSNTDPLTGLANRRALEATVARWQTQASPGDWASLLLIDVDHFKAVNDRFGHDEGDRVLTLLSNALRSSKRANDLAARYGGEEFAVWLPSADRTGADYAANRVHNRMRDVVVSGQAMTVSIGIASTNEIDDPQLLAQMIARADRAVYEAKAAGRNRTVHSEQSAMLLDS
jgi:sigma-B regulation protein RsbU (phosphoserine phosphatase)